MSKPLLVLGCLLAMTCSYAESPQVCPPAEGVTLQVLGSGGPIADDGRSSTSYVVWVDGRSRALIDAGSGSFVRFGEAGADFADLDFVGLSHFHTDHAADFVALLKSGNFSDRRRPLPVAGPSGNDRFPGLGEFLNANLDRDTGAYRYLGGYLDGTGGRPRLVQSEIGAETVPRNILEDMGSELGVYAQPVPHGIVPALGFRIEVRGKSIVFASDQNGSDPGFTEFARNADVLVMHLVIPEGAGNRAKQLHAEPSRIGEVARAANPGSLLLSHFMARSLADLAGNVEQVARSFDGDILVADDLDCLLVD